MLQKLFKTGSKNSFNVLFNYFFKHTGVSELQCAVNLSKKYSKLVALRLLSLTKLFIFQTASLDKKQLVVFVAHVLNELALVISTCKGGFAIFQVT